MKQIIILLAKVIGIFACLYLSEQIAFYLLNLSNYFTPIIGIFIGTIAALYAVYFFFISLKEFLNNKQ